MTQPRQHLRVYFFGCIGQTGHYLYPARGSPGVRLRELPWGDQVDAGLCPRGGPESEGHAAIHHLGGWTALSWWDRSVDRRHRSNSTLMVAATHDLSGMLALLEEHFPAVLARQRHPITLTIEEF